MASAAAPVAASPKAATPGPTVTAAAIPTPTPKLAAKPDLTKTEDKSFAAMMGVSKAMKAFGKLGKGKKKDGDENKHSAKKDTFLIDACAQGSLNLVIKFIGENGCSPNLKSPEGKSLIQIALEGGHEEVVM